MPSTKRWGGLRPAPYNPNARDADHDGIVQEGTVWERPGGTRFVSAVGHEIAAAVSRPTPGSYIADADGNRVSYAPKKPMAGAAGVAAAGMPKIGDIGHPPIGDTNRTIGSVVGTVASPPEVPEPDKRDVEAPGRVVIPDVAESIAAIDDVLNNRVPRISDAVPETPPAPSHAVSPITGEEWVPEAGLVPSAIYPGVYHVEDMFDLRDELQGLPRAEWDRRYDELRANQARELHRRRSVLGTSREWDHIARVPSDTELGDVMASWRSGFSESAAYRQRLSGASVAPAYDNDSFRKNADKLADALEKSDGLGFETWRVQTAPSPERGDIVDFAATSTATSRKDAESYLASTDVFGDIYRGRGANVDPVMYRFPEDAPGLLHDDESPMPREAIVTGRYRVKSVKVEKIDGRDVKVAELEYVEPAELKRLPEETDTIDPDEIDPGFITVASVDDIDIDPNKFYHVSQTEIRDGRISSHDEVYGEGSYLGELKGNGFPEDYARQEEWRGQYVFVESTPDLDYGNYVYEVETVGDEPFGPWSDSGLTIKPESHRITRRFLIDPDAAKIEETKAYRSGRPFKPVKREAPPPAFGGRASDIADGAGDWATARDRLRGQRIVVFDYETTGFPDESGKGSNRPVEVAASVFVDGVLVDRFHTFVNPGESTSEWSDFSQRTLVDDNGNSLSDAFLSGKPSVDEATRMLVEFMGEDSLIAAHNLPFDEGVLEQSAREAGIDFSPAGTVDTLQLARDLLVSKYQDKDGYDVESHRLKTLADHFGIELESWHTASADTDAAGELLFKLLDDAVDREASTDLLSAAKQEERYRERVEENERRFMRANIRYAEAMAEFDKHRTQAHDVIPDDLTDFSSEVPMKDIVGRGDELWHVSTALSAVKKDGFKDGGVGFGTDLDGGPPGVSVTYSRRAAESFDEQIKTAVKAAQGADPDQSIVEPLLSAANDEVTITELAEAMGMDTTDFIDEWDMQALLDNFDGDGFDLYESASQAMWDIMDERIEWQTDADFGDDLPAPRGLGWTLMPVVSDRDKLEGLDLDDIGITKVSSKGEAIAADSLTHELRFNAGDVSAVSEDTHLVDTSIPEPPEIGPGEAGEPLRFSPESDLGKIVADETTGSGELKALFDPEMVPQAEDPFVDLTDEEAAILAEEVRQHSQRSLEHRGLPETFVVWRQRNGRESDDSVESFSLSRTGSTFEDQEPFVVNRGDILVDSNAFYPNASALENEVMLPFGKATPRSEVAKAYVDRRMPSDPNEAEQFLRDKYDGISISLSGGRFKDLEGNPIVTLGAIRVPEDKRNSGIGTAALEDIARWADVNGYTIALSPSDEFGGNVRRLEEFYPRFGFVKNSGRDKDHSIRETMYRLPKSIDAEPPSLDQPEVNALVPGEYGVAKSFVRFGDDPLKGLNLEEARALFAGNDEARRVARFADMEDSRLERLRGQIAEHTADSLANPKHRKLPERFVAWKKAGDDSDLAEVHFSRPSDGDYVPVVVDRDSAVIDLGSFGRRPEDQALIVRSADLLDYNGDVDELTKPKVVRVSEKVTVPQYVSSAYGDRRAASTRELKEWTQGYGSEPLVQYSHSPGGINAQLRSGVLSEDAAKLVESLDTAIDGSVTGHEHQVYRGMPASALVGDTDDVEGALLDLVGETISDKGYLSTSSSPHVATRFAGERDSSGAMTDRQPGIVMRINVPEGDKGGAYIQSRFTEDEIVYGRDTKLRVDGVRLLEKPDNKGRPIYILDMSMQPDEPEPKVQKPEDIPDPALSDFGEFVDNADFLAQYAAASEADKPDIMRRYRRQEAEWYAARADVRRRRAEIVGQSIEVELGEPRETPPMTTMTDTSKNFNVPGRKVQRGARVQDSVGSGVLDLSEAGIKRRIDSVIAQVEEDFGTDVDGVVYALDWGDWWNVADPEKHRGAVAFFEDGKIYLSPSVTRDLGSSDPETYVHAVKIVSHELGHASSGAVKNDLPNTGLRPVVEEAGAELSALSHQFRRLPPEMMDSIRARVPTKDGYKIIDGRRAASLSAAYPERVEETILSGVRRNGWNREAVLNDVMHTFTEGDPEDLLRDGNSVVRIVAPDAGADNPIGEGRWRSVWSQAPESIMEAFSDIDPAGTYGGSNTVIGEEHLTEQQWVERQVRVAALVYWLLGGEGV